MKLNFFLILTLSLFLNAFSMEKFNILKTKDLELFEFINNQCKKSENSITTKKWKPQCTPSLNYKLCHIDDEKILERFLKLGARPDDLKQGCDCPILKAAREEKIDKFKLFLKYKSDDIFDILIFQYGPLLLHFLVGRIAQIQHSRSNNLIPNILEIINILLMHGANPNFIMQGSEQKETAWQLAEKLLSQKKALKENIPDEEKQFAYEVLFFCGRSGIGDRVINLDRQIYRLEKIIEGFENHSQNIKI